tara:strand:+ start:11629 stop:12105 length:477 start_codon:yes stop_codon:yes gene_type:complete
MEYKRLSKEQFEALHQEFSTFLAAYSIDKKNWYQLKIHHLDQADSILNEFSDLVWNDVLKKNLFVEHLNPKHLFLFECLEDQMNLILVNTEDSSIDFTSEAGISWMEANMHSDSVSIFQSQKKYKNRKQDIFDLIEKGGRLSEGVFYKSIASFLSKTR